MKILQMVSGTHVNGALMYCYLLSKQLADRGHDVTVMCRRQSWIWDKLQDTSVKRIACDMKRRLPQVRFAKAFIRDQQIDVCHTHMSRAHFFGVIMRHVTKIPCVATAHACHFQLHWPFNDFVIANSEDTLRYHRNINRVPKDRLKTIYCFSDLDKFIRSEESAAEKIRKQYRVKPDDFLLGVVGDVIPRKGQKLLLESLPRLLTTHPNVKLAIVGRFLRDQPYVRQIRRFVLKNGLADRVIWTGRSDQVQNHMRAMDACIVPSVAEPLGLVAMEAMAVGTPVVASNVGGLPEIIETERNGLLFDRKHPESLRQAIERLIDDESLRSKLMEQGRRDVAERFAPRVLAEEVEQILHDVVETQANGLNLASQNVA